MRLYRARVQIYLGAWSPTFTPALTAESLAKALGDALVCEFDLRNEGHEVEVLLRRPNSEHALCDIASVIQEFGFAIGETIIVEYASAVAESTLTGFAGGGAFGLRNSSPVVRLAAASAGALIGAIVGRFIQVERARYRATWDPFSMRGYMTQIPAPASREMLLGYE